MTSRPYALIECGLTGSKRLRALPSAQARWAYVCTHLSDRCGFTGLFTSPPHIWGHDAQLDAVELDGAIEQLTASGLIEYCPDDHWVRITRWFLKQNAPENPNRVRSAIADLSASEAPPAMVMAAASELAVGSVKRSLGWKPDGTARDQLAGDLRAFLGDLNLDHGAPFLARLAAETASAPKRVTSELGVIFPPLTLHLEATLREPLPNPSATVSKHEHDTTRHDTDTHTTKKRDDKDTAHVSSSGANLDVVPGGAAGIGGEGGQVARARPETIASAQRMAFR